jgi:hypothetical protein
MRPPLGGDAQSDAQAQLQAMAVAWSRLPSASRRRIAQVIRDEFEQAFRSDS